MCTYAPFSVCCLKKINWIICLVLISMCFIHRANGRDVGKGIFFSQIQQNETHQVSERNGIQFFFGQNRKEMNECTRKIALMVLWILPTYTPISVHLRVCVLVVGRCMRLQIGCVYNLCGSVAVYYFIVVVTFLKGIYIHVPINTILNFDGDTRKKDCFQFWLTSLLFGCCCYFS